MRTIRAAAFAGLLVLPAASLAGEAGDRLAQHLYEGTLAEAYEDNVARCEAAEADACFALGVTDLIAAAEGLSQALYRHGATTPGAPAAAMMLGLDGGWEQAPANPDPEPLTYEGLRAIFEDFSARLDVAGGHFQQATDGDYAILIDPLRVRVDFDGDGTAVPEETLGMMLRAVGEFADIPAPDAPPDGAGKSKSKAAEPAPDTSIGFDAADAAWFAGYTNVTRAPIELLLAHDFSDFYDAYLHRVFPEAGLPMQDYSAGGTLFMDAESDAFLADVVAAIHTAEFPVTDRARLAGVLDILKAITSLSRQNWELILAETDDNRELVPSPRQTSLVPETPVTQEIVDAWLATLDTVDAVLAGELLVPHWRFRQGVDLAAYFTTATETDLVMLFTGHDAIPYLKDSPVADAESFAEANRVFGTDWINFALWFN